MSQFLFLEQNIWEVNMFLSKFTEGKEGKPTKAGTVVSVLKLAKKML